eukprot:TRINITY_DN20582_c0_g1_i1.p1 TRINITY_DN20582_c0_g1~~TRINITY_DN20582_c0_g1_i1.p1  ORF type:complete len:1126 (-),score=287.31 TRINITY_DN20582_c0_g1_i1:88-3465(-)
MALVEVATPEMKAIQDLVKTASAEEVRSKVTDAAFAAESSLLYHAAMRSKVEDTVDICRYLVENLGLPAAPPLNSANAKSPLTLAAEAGVPETIAYLLQSGAKVDDTDRLKQTPLFFAAAAGNLETLRELMRQKADPLHPDMYGHTALFYAVRAKKNQQDTIEALVNASPPGVAVRVAGTGDGGKTALFYTVLPLSSDTACRALLDAGADVNAREAMNQQTTLFFAAVKGKTSVVELLLERRANPDIKDVNGQTALHYAAGACHFGVCRALLQIGRANPHVRGKAASSSALDVLRVKAEAEFMPSGKNPGKSTASVVSGFSGVSATEDSAADTAASIVALCEELFPHPQQAQRKGFAGRGAPKRASGPKAPPKKAAPVPPAPSEASGTNALDAAQPPDSRNAVSTPAMPAAKRRKLIKNAEQALQHHSSVKLDYTARQGSVQQLRQFLETIGGINQVPPMEVPMLHLVAGRKPAWKAANDGASDVAESTVGASDEAAAAAEATTLEACRFLIEEAGCDPCTVDSTRRQTALFHAAAVGNFEVCQYLVQSRCDPNAIDSTGRNAIFSAVQSLNSTDPIERECLPRQACRIAVLLAEARADANLRDSMGRSPLFMAIEETRIPMAAALLDNCGARPPEEGVDKPYEVKYSYGNTCLFEMARERGLPDIVSRLHQVRRRRQAELQVTEKLFAAAVTGQATNLAVVLADGADVNAVGPGGTHVLHHVLQKAGAMADTACQMLLAQRADATACDSRGQTPLVFACAEGHLGALAALLENRADPNAVAVARASATSGAADGRTPLFAAAAAGQVAALDALLRAGARADAADDAGMTALFVAKDAQIAARLADASCDISARDVEGRTALFAAAERTDDAAPLVQLLLDRGARADATSLGRGAGAGGGSAAGAGSAAGLSRMRQGTSRRTRSGRGAAGGMTTALHLAADRRVVRMLLGAHAAIDARDANGQTPLFAAARRGDCSTLMALARAGADASVRDAHGRTALQHALAAGVGKAVVDALIHEAFAEPTAADLRALARQSSSAPTAATSATTAAEVEEDRLAAQQLLRSRLNVAPDEDGRLMYQLRFEDPRDPTGVTAIKPGTPAYEERLQQLLAQYPSLAAAAGMGAVP